MLAEKMSGLTLGNRSEQDRNCNSMWPSPYDQESTSWTGDQGASMLRPPHGNNSRSEVIVSLQRNVSEFWKQHDVAFKAFWTQMRHQSRENYVRSVHPTIVQSLRDRYCVQKGSRIYEERHDRDLMLAPKMTIEGLISGSYLIGLIDSLSDLEAMQNVSDKMVLELRRLCRYKRFPFTKAELAQRNNDTPAHVGQTFVMQGGATFGLNISIEDTNILAQIVTEDYNLFKLGKLSYQHEFDIVSSVVYRIYALVGKLLDEFRVKVLGSTDGRSVLDTSVACGYCSKLSGEGVVLKQCRQCLSVHYCSV